MGKREVKEGGDRKSSRTHTKATENHLRKASGFLCRIKYGHGLPPLPYPLKYMAEEVGDGQLSRYDAELFERLDEPTKLLTDGEVGLDIDLMAAMAMPLDVAPDDFAMETIRRIDDVLSEGATGARQRMRSQASFLVPYRDKKTRHSAIQAERAREKSAAAREASLTGEMPLNVSDAAAVAEAIAAQFEAAKQPIPDRADGAKVVSVLPLLPTRSWAEHELTLLEHDGQILPASDGGAPPLYYFTEDPTRQDAMWAFQLAAVDEAAAARPGETLAYAVRDTFAPATLSDEDYHYVLISRSDSHVVEFVPLRSQRLSMRRSSDPSRHKLAAEVLMK